MVGSLEVVCIVSDDVCGLAVQRRYFLQQIRSSVYIIRPGSRAVAWWLEVGYFKGSVQHW